MALRPVRLLRLRLRQVDSQRKERGPVQSRRLPNGEGWGHGHVVVEAVVVAAAVAVAAAAAEVGEGEKNFVG